MTTIVLLSPFLPSTRCGGRMATILYCLLWLGLGDGAVVDMEGGSSRANGSTALLRGSKATRRVEGETAANSDEEGKAEDRGVEQSETALNAGAGAATAASSPPQKSSETSENLNRNKQSSTSVESIQAQIEKTTVKRRNKKLAKQAKARTGGGTLPEEDPVEQLIGDFGLIDVLAEDVVDEGDGTFSRIAASFVQEEEEAWSPKPLWPMNARDWISFLLVSLVSVIAACGGIGGGALFVPLYMMVLQFPTANASALSNVTIFGGSIANLMFNFSKKTDKGDALIDWNIILMMEPSTILGAVIGTLINKLVPVFVLQCLLFVLLLLMGQNTLEKGQKRWQKERERITFGAREFPTFSAAPMVENAAATLPPSPTALPSSRGLATQGTIPEPQGRNPNPTSQQDDTTTCWSPECKKFVSFLPLYIACLVLQILRGDGHDFNPIANCGTPGYWMVILANIPVVLLAMFLYRRQILAEVFQRHVRSSLYFTTPAILRKDKDEIGTTSGRGNSTGTGPLPSLTATGTTDLGSSSGRVTLSSSTARGAANPNVLDSASSPRSVYSTDSTRVDGFHPLANQTTSSSVLSNANDALDTTNIQSSRDRKQPHSTATTHAPDPLSASCATTGSSTTVDEPGGALFNRPNLSISSSSSRATVNNPLQTPQLSSSSSSSSTSSSHGSIKWDERNTVLYPAVCTASGLMAGMFGIGGGIVKGPLMLALGVEPNVASATAATMIFFTASTACVSFTLFGYYALDYALFAFFLGFLFAAVGQGMIAQLFAERQAPIILSMAVIILLSACAVAVQAGETFLYKEHLFEFNNLCEPE
ncbi:unnamed protein product [Amoebophrya sp. A120]|nr:unnamed protein product [Amoebophrya sp. A120]|eukprot:GSA120T00017654001.1